MLKVYNSLTNSIEEFKVLADTVRLYSCGPTVYDNIHIGNLSSFIFADSINRVLELNGYKIKHVMNITDVDDKIIRTCKLSYPDLSPEEALLKVTRKYESSFNDDLNSVGNRLDKLTFIRATDSIKNIQQLIIKLLNLDFAYIADDGIYFSIENYKKSGKTYGQLVELNENDNTQARINNDEYDKDSAHDFALWKFIRPDEPAWSFVIDDKDYLGRPGWHIECSSMSEKLLNVPFDIHTGGIDLKFPHHENEIAQSTAGNESDIYAKTFLHNEHLLFDKHKMSKSLGNVYTIRDLLERGYDPIIFRLLVLQGHYRNQSNFSWGLMDAVQSRYKSIINFTELKFQTNNNVLKRYDFKKYKDEILEAMNNDFNTPQALAILSNFQNEAQEDLISIEQLQEFNDFLNFIDIVFGLSLNKIDDIDEATKTLIIDREGFRKENNWVKSDEIRDKIKKVNIGVRDTPHGSIWFSI